MNFNDSVNVFEELLNPAHVQESVGEQSHEQQSMFVERFFNFIRTRVSVCFEVLKHFKNQLKYLYYF